MSDSATEYVQTKVLETFSASFDIDPQLLSMDATTGDILGWDSAGHLFLASNLEEAFGISLDVDELMEMESVREVVHIVTAKLSKKVQR